MIWSSISISPNDARVRYNLGWVYNDQSRFADAAAQLSEAARLKPEYVEAHTELGFALLKLHRLPAATDALRTAIRLKNDHSTAHLYLGFVFIEQKDQQGVRTQYGILRQMDAAKAQQLLDATPADLRN